MTPQNVSPIQLPGSILAAGLRLFLAIDQMVYCLRDAWPECPPDIFVEVHLSRVRTCFFDLEKQILSRPVPPNTPPAPPSTLNPPSADPTNSPGEGPSIVACG